MAQSEKIKNNTGGDLKKIKNTIAGAEILDAAFSPPHASSLAKNFSIVKTFFLKYFENFEN
jgi:hypothetical protein